MRFSPAISILSVLGLTGCNLIFGIQEGTLDGDGGGTASSTGSGVICGGVDCNDNNPCTDDRCNNQQCEHPPALQEQIASLQIPGDCKEIVCDDNPTPHTTTINDDDDSPPGDGNPCTLDSCENGVPYPNGPMGEPCEGNKVCNSAGACIACVQPYDCGEDTVCGTFTCESNVCGINAQTAGAIVDNGVEGDCQGFYCNGRDASTTPMELNSDIPTTDPDPNDCTRSACNNGTPTFFDEPLPGGTPCDHQTLEAGDVCQNDGVCADCDPTLPPSSGHCDTGHVCKASGNCCAPPPPELVCGGNCAAVTESNCNTSIACTCATSPKGAVCNAGTAACGCASASDCNNARLGSSCVTVGGQQRCGCSTSGECGSSKFGTRCIGSPTANLCGCQNGGDCIGVVLGSVCKANQQCGCMSANDCLPGLNCDSALQACI